MTALADSIRTQGNTSAPLSFPDGMISAIQAIRRSSYAFNAEAYMSTSGLTEVADPLGYVSYLRMSAFGNRNELSSVNFPACQTIGMYAFTGCSLQTVSFPACETISYKAFSGQSYLTSANFPACQTIGASAFVDCSALAQISFPNCTTVGSNAFYNCSALVSAHFPQCTAIGTSAFYNCTSLSKVRFPVCTTMSNAAFDNCKALRRIDRDSFPVLTELSFSRCPFYYTSSNTGSGIAAVHLPACSNVGNTFSSVTTLYKISLPMCTAIASYAFSSCRLISVYLFTSTVPTLGSSRAFSSNYYYSITFYVKASLLSAFKSATNWAAWRNRIVGKTDEEIAALDAMEDDGIIHFSIGSNEYSADEGMTWWRWVNSPYNTGGYTIDSYGDITNPSEHGVGYKQNASAWDGLIEADDPILDRQYYDINLGS